MANKNLYLIGTIHIDLKGPERLEKLLKHLSPDIVALEFHKDREILIKQRENITIEEEKREIDNFFNEAGFSLTLEQKSAMLEYGRNINSVMGYEFNVSKAYTDSNPKSRLEYIDISVFENGFQEFKEGYIAVIKGMLAGIAQETELKKQFLEMLSNEKEAFLKQSMKEINRIYQNTEMIEELTKLIRDPEIFEAMKEQMPANAVQTFKQIHNPKRDEVMANKINKLYDRGSHKLVAITGLLHTPGLKSRILDLDPTVMTLADYDFN